MSAYFRQLPYRRILCLMMAATQMFPLPEPVGETFISAPVPLLRLFPEHSDGDFHAA